MTSCDDCGVGSRGALIREHGVGRELCEDCWPTGECGRCGNATDETTLSGEYRCRRCQETIRSRDSTRDASQSGLDNWGESA